jgi:hypothetical protein
VLCPDLRKRDAMGGGIVLQACQMFRLWCADIMSRALMVG